MIRPKARAALTACLALALGGALAGCGSDARSTEGTRLAGGEIGRMLNGLLHRGKAEAGPGPDAETMARQALADNQGPLILTNFESQNSTTIFGLSGENGTMRTYASPASQALILRDGLVAGSRGFGFDVMSGEVDALGALVRDRRAGTADYTLRYLDGLGQERPVPMQCTVTPGPEQSYPFAGQTWSGTLMAAHCTTSGGYAFDDTFIVAETGAVLSSRQWIGPEIGFVTIQTVRP